MMEGCRESLWIWMTELLPWQTYGGFCGEGLFFLASLKKYHPDGETPCFPMVSPSNHTVSHGFPIFIESSASSKARCRSWRFTDLAMSPRRCGENRRTVEHHPLIPWIFHDFPWYIFL